MTELLKQSSGGSVEVILNPCEVRTCVCSGGHAIVEEADMRTSFPDVGAVAKCQIGPAGRGSCFFSVTFGSEGPVGPDATLENHPSDVCPGSIAPWLPWS